MPQNPSCGVRSTVHEYVRLATVGAMIRAMACKKPRAPSSSPVCDLGISLVMLASDVVRPTAPRDATAPERVKRAPVGAIA